MSAPATAIEITTRTVYVPQQSDPDGERYVFAYTVTIHNAGSEAAQLLNRHWVITDGAGKVQEVRGEGVVGEQPRLEPGESFEYTSAAMIETPVGSMHGAYGMTTDNGDLFEAPIPAFSLSIPSMVH